MKKRLGLVLFPAVILSACLQSTTVVKVNADGSGTLENQTLMTAAALAQLRQLSGAFAGDSKAPELFSEQQARAMAPQMGEGVTLLSTMPIAAAGSEGRATVYAFRDITKLRVNQTPATPGDSSLRAGGLGVGGRRTETPVTIDLARTNAGTMLLTFHTSADPLSALLGQSGPIARNSGGQPPIDQLAVMRQMMAGMHVALRVEPAGRVVRSNSPFVDGQTVTLFDMDVDSLLNNEQAIQQLQAAKTPAETAEVLKTVPGLKIAPERDITVEFAP